LITARGSNGTGRNQDPDDGRDDDAGLPVRAALNVLIRWEAKRLDIGDRVRDHVGPAKWSSSSIGDASRPAKCGIIAPA
jgi:hypothetical protein